MRTIIEKAQTNRMRFTKTEIIELDKAIDEVCLYCPRPVAWKGGEETCNACMVRKLSGLLWDDWQFWMDWHATNGGTDRA